MNLSEMEQTVYEFSNTVEKCLEKLNSGKVCKYDVYSTQYGYPLEKVGCNNDCDNCKYATTSYSWLDCRKELNPMLNKITELFLYAIENRESNLRLLLLDIDMALVNIQLEKVKRGGDDWQELERVMRWHNELTKIEDKTSMETTRVKPNQNKKAVETPLHFKSSQPPDKLTAIFDSLKGGGYFDANADLQTWLYICGVAELEGDFRPLNWVADKQLLGIVITKLFDSDKHQYWKVTQQVFLVGGDKLTTNIIDGIKNSVSKITNDWRKAPPKANHLISIIAK